MKRREIKGGIKGDCSEIITFEFHRDVVSNVSPKQDLPAIKFNNSTCFDHFFFFLSLGLKFF